MKASGDTQSVIQDVDSAPYARSTTPRLEW